MILVFAFLVLGGFALAYIAGRTRLYSPKPSYACEAISWLATITGAVGLLLSLYSYSSELAPWFGIFGVILLAAAFVDALRKIGRRGRQLIFGL